MSFKFEPICKPINEVQKVDLKHGLSLMVYAAIDDTPYDREYLCGDGWQLVSFSNTRDERVAEAFSLLGIAPEDGTPDLESLLDNHTDAVLACVRGKPFAGDFTEFQTVEQIEWLREGLYDDERITDCLTALWNTGIATDQCVPILDVYDHSGVTWSFSGQGVQCQWDTACGAGCLLPSDETRKHLFELAKTDHRPMRELAREEAKDFLKSYNDMNNGNVFHVVGELVDSTTGAEISTKEFPMFDSGHLDTDEVDEVVGKPGDSNDFVAANAGWLMIADDVAERRHKKWVEHIQAAVDESCYALKLDRPTDSFAQVLAEKLQVPTNFVFEE